MIKISSRYLELEYMALTISALFVVLLSKDIFEFHLILCSVKLAWTNNAVKGVRLRPTCYTSPQ